MFVYLFVLYWLIFFILDLSGSSSILHCCSVSKSCPTLCNSMDCSKPGFTVLYYLPEFAQTHVHRVGDAIQPSHPLPPPSPPAFNLSQHQGLFPMSQFFTSGSQSIRASASVLPRNVQGWFPLGLTALISLLSGGLSGVFSNRTSWKHQFFGAHPSLWSNSHILLHSTTPREPALDFTYYFPFTAIRSQKHYFHLPSTNLR